MNEELLKTAKFEVKIKTPKHKFQIHQKDISYGAAMALCEDVLEKFPDDEILQEQLTACMDSFGFRGFGGANGYDITISAYRPTIKTEEEHQCPQRVEGPWAYGNGTDVWEIRGDDKCCSYCGSLHPDRVIELMKEHGVGIIERSTKNYKWYVNRPNIPNASFGGIKYYRHHDTEEFINQFNELISKSKQ